MERVLTRQLADLLPSEIEEGLRRARVVKDFIELNTTSVKELQRHAEMVGVGPRMFYNLVRIFKERHVSKSRGGGKGASAPTDPKTADAIDGAIRDLGPSAIDSEVQAMAKRICVARGLPPPTRRAVSRRFYRQTAKPDLGGRLGVDADRILDCCPLGVDTVDGEHAAPAYLAALIDLRSGRVLRHAVTRSLPTGDQILAISPRQERVLLIATAEAARVLRNVGIEADAAFARSGNARGRRLTSGVALRAVFGPASDAYPLRPAA